MKHYEIILFKPVNIGNRKFFKDFCSCRVFKTKRNAIKYAKFLMKLNEYPIFKVVKVETKINGDFCKGYSGLELKRKALKGV